MTNQRPRVLFETVAKLAGLNVMFDPEHDAQQTIRSQSIRICALRSSRRSISSRSLPNLFWKLCRRTHLVTVDNLTKRRDYSEQVVKVFTSNVTAPQEMQEMLTVPEP